MLPDANRPSYMSRMRPPRSVISMSPAGKNASAHGWLSPSVSVTTRTRACSVTNTGRPGVAPG